MARGAGGVGPDDGPGAGRRGQGAGGGRRLARDAEERDRRAADRPGDHQVRQRLPGAADQSRPEPRLAAPGQGDPGGWPPGVLRRAGQRTLRRLVGRRAIGLRRPVGPGRDPAAGVHQGQAAGTAAPADPEAAVPLPRRGGELRQRAGGPPGGYIDAAGRQGPLPGRGADHRLRRPGPRRGHHGPQAVPGVGRRAHPARDRRAADRRPRLRQVHWRLRQGDQRGRRRRHRGRRRLSARPAGDRRQADRPDRAFGRRHDRPAGGGQGPPRPAS